MSDQHFNSIRGEFSIDLGDRTFVLVPSFRNLAMLESALGRSVLGFTKDFIEKQELSVRDAVLLVDTLMKVPAKPDKKPTPDEIGEMLLETGLINTIAPIIANLVGRLSGAPPSQGGSEGNG